VCKGDSKSKRPVSHETAYCSDYDFGTTTQRDCIRVFPDNKQGTSLGYGLGQTDQAYEQ
jgi:hypothetical protein